jgi:Flp pilus assembly protein TadG
MKRRTGELGQTMPIVAMILVVLLGFAGLSADVGYYRYQQRVQQTAADSAAIAGAKQLVASTGATSNASVTTAARNDSATNGFTDTSSGTGCGGTSPAAGCVSVQVNNPPGSGPYAGNAAAVEVLVTKQQPRFFMNIFGSAAVPVTTRAVAVVNYDDNGCFFSLNTGAPANFSNLTVNAPTCSLKFNDPGVNLQGDTLNVAGVDCAGTCHNLASPPNPPITPILPAPDPCPAIQGCAYLQNMSSTLAAANGSNLTMKNGGTIYPGTYNNMDLSGNITVSPGTYVINGTLKASGASMTGSDVTFFIGPNGSMDVHQTTAMNLSACTTCSIPSAGTAPPYGTGVQNVLFYQAPPGPSNILFNQNGNFSLTGLVYFPNQKVTMNQVSGGYTVLVVGNGNFNQSTFGFTGFPGQGKSMILRAVLGE